MSLKRLGSFRRFRKSNSSHRAAQGGLEDGEQGGMGSKNEHEAVKRSSEENCQKDSSENGGNFYLDNVR